MMKMMDCFYKFLRHILTFVFEYQSSTVYVSLTTIFVKASSLFRGDCFFNLYTFALLHVKTLSLNLYL